MVSLVSERNTLEEGLSVIKNAKLEFSNPVSEMYGAMQRQYTQVRTIKLQGKAQDYVKKVMHDSKFFCILTKLITQAINQSRTLKQQTANINRVHKWYTTNLHKLHFAEQPAFRRHDSDENIAQAPSVSLSLSQERKTSTPSKMPKSEVKENVDSEDNVMRPTSTASSSTTPNRAQSSSSIMQSRGVKRQISRPKSVTWRETDGEKKLDEEASVCEELWEGESENKSEETDGPGSPASKQRSFDVVRSVAERRTPDYHLVDDRSYIDTVSKANELAARHNSPVGRPYTPVVYEYIEQIQREVNKVQGHPSDLYPELYTPHIVSALIDENEDLQPMKKLASTEVGRELRKDSTEQFFSLADRYRPKSVKKFSSLQPRKDQKPRPKTSLPIANSRSSLRPQEPKTLQLKDVISLTDFASAEISYEKESGLRAILNRPKDTPARLQSAPRMLEIEAPPSTWAEETPLLPRNSASSPTQSQSMASVVDWRGQVTPTCNESQQDVFRSHSYAKTSTKRSTKGRPVGATSAGFRPRTASASLYQNRLRNSEEKAPVQGERVAQSASNTVVEIDKGTTKALLNITNLKAATPRRHKSASSAELVGGYADLLASGYYVPPSSVYEYESYPYEYEPLPKSFTFMEEEDGHVDVASPRNVEYFSIVQSIGPDIDRLRNESKREIRVERLNTPASSVKTKEGSPPVAESLASACDEGVTATDGVKEGDNSEPNKRISPDQLMSIQSLVPSPLFQHTAYPTPAGGVLRTRSPQGRGSTLTKDPQSTDKVITPVTFQPPFSSEDFEKGSKPKSAGKLKSSLDKSQVLVRPVRSAPSIPSLNNAYGSRSPKLRRNHPFSGEHDRSAHKQLNPQEYLKKVQAMREEDPVQEEPEGEDLGTYLAVRPMSSRRQEDYPDLTMSIHNAIKFEIPQVDRGTPSPTFMTELKAGRRNTTPINDRPGTGRAKSARSSSQSRPDSSRPIPQYMKAESWEKTQADSERQREAAAAVSIQKIFRGYVSRMVYLNLRSDYRREQENQRLSAIKIQRSWRGHRAKLSDIYNKPAVKEETLQWAREFKISQQRAQAERELKRESDNSQVRKQERTEKAKISMIGPHVEVYSAYHPPKTGVSKQVAEKAAIKIQKIVRGRQSRNYLNVVKEKAKYHAASWSEWVSYYKQFLRRILIRRGIDKPSIEINLEQMLKFMAQKKRYEGVFERRAFGGELEEDEFVQFFKECDLMPASHEIEHAMDLVFKGKPRGNRTTLKKKEVLDVVFEIYKPEGTRIVNDRKSTWLHPIVDGEDAMKLLGTDQVEPTPLRPCLKLVSESMKERKERAEEEERLRLMAEQSANRKTASTADSSPRSVISVPSDNVSSKAPPTQRKIFSDEPLLDPKSS